jgi:predicted secreted protein
MPAEKGSAFLLKVGDGATTPVFSTVAGLVEHRIRMLASSP